MKLTFEVSLPKPCYSKDSIIAATAEARQMLEDMIDNLPPGFAAHPANDPFVLQLDYQEADTDLPDEGSHYWLVTVD